MFTGNGFILRRWKEGDEVSLQKHANNPNVSRYLKDRFPYPYTIEDATDWVSYNLRLEEPIVNFALDIAGEVAGGIGIELRGDIYHQSGIIGYWLAEPFWGKGIMPQAVRFLTDYAFSELGLIRLQAGVFSKNTASMRVLEKAGYTCEAILRNAVIKNGELMDEHLYAILKD